MVWVLVWLDNDSDDDVPVANRKVVNRPLKWVLNSGVKFNAV